MKPANVSGSDLVRREDAGVSAPRVSVIIPFHQGFDFLRSCLRSLRTQTLGAECFEIIAINNDPGGEEAAAVAAEFPEVRWLAEPTVGSYSARNRGIRAARGEWLAFTDADCVPTSEWLERGLAAVATGDYEMVGGRVDFIDPVGRAKNACEWLEEEFTLLAKQRYSVESLGVAATANLFARRELFDRVGGFETRLMSYGDGEWTKRAIAAGARLGYADDALVRHPRRSSFFDLTRKAVRVGGDRLAYLRHEGASGWELLGGVFRMSPLDVRLHWRALTFPADIGPVQRGWIMVLATTMSALAMGERARVLLGFRSYRG